MESRKYQLKQQIIEALNSKNTDLYALLKSQWAHRFGVDSLDELSNLDLNEINQTTYKGEDKPQDKPIEDSLQVSIEEDENVISNEEKEITEDSPKQVESIQIDSLKSSESKSYEINENGKDEAKIKDSALEIKKIPLVKALIPLPPKPKYGYLKKWLNNRF